MLTSPDGRTPGHQTSGLSPLARLLLWDYDRGSGPYDVAILLVVLALFLVPGAFWADPLWVWP